MPFRDVETCLEDILESSETIGTFLSGMDYASYQADLKTKRAVERVLQILTEAAYRLGADGPRLCPQIDWRSVRDLGNVLRHECHAVDDEQIWTTLKDDLPSLHRAVETALQKIRSDPDDEGLS